MYEYDYSSVNLSLKEKYKLFVIHKKKTTTEKFLGDSKDYLLEIRFIKANYSGDKNEIGEQIPNGTYSTTWYYGRYLIWKRNKAFYGILSSFVTPIIVSIVISVLTVLVLKLLGLS